MCILCDNNFPEFPEQIIGSNYKPKDYLIQTTQVCRVRKKDINIMYPDFSYICINCGTGHKNFLSCQYCDGSLDQVKSNSYTHDWNSSRKPDWWNSMISLTALILDTADKNNINVMCFLGESLSISKLMIQNENNKIFSNNKNIKAVKVNGSFRGQVDNPSKEWVEYLKRKINKGLNNNNLGIKNIAFIDFINEGTSFLRLANVLNKVLEPTKFKINLIPVGLESAISNLQSKISPNMEVKGIPINNDLNKFFIDEIGKMVMGRNYNRRYVDEWNDNKIKHETYEKHNEAKRGLITTLSRFE
nr:hypothetical protein GTC16762_19180 [Pigmentibacter ruber]